MRYLLVILLVAFIFWLPWANWFDNGVASSSSAGGSTGGGGCVSPYEIQPGETLSQIAARCGISLAQLAQANPGIGNLNSVAAGQLIIIPGVVQSNTTGAIPVTGARLAHVVQPGDTLSQVAARYGRSLGEVLAANPTITNPHRIYPGQQIVIP